MNHFKYVFRQYTWDQMKQRIEATTLTDVRNSISRKKKTIDDFCNLISPVAAAELEYMAQTARAITQKRFGKTVQLFAPMYLSNECQNICTYCGFSLGNKIRRKTLSSIEIMQEAAALKAMGVAHVLLVSGEADKIAGIDYFMNAVQLLRPHFAHISIEVQPLLRHEYSVLQQAGVHAVLVYQETYHEKVYRQYHPKGKKSNFQFRLDTPDRIGKAGLHKMGLGVLLGLEDWRVDSFFNALHIDYLQKTYWQTKYSVSFPRLRPAKGVAGPNFLMQDRDLLQLICAYRIWNEDLDISISTREAEKFRDHIIQLGPTSMSAGSKTNPGGYAVADDSLEQFEVGDHRTMEVFKTVVKNAGYNAVMKDWEGVYS
ncbi:2-iminoacetate synthase ThiH [Niabella insulamsoli]|uniref:2-iminoacetate synthase ThiH n=1 Tax=Niabella insulamsoli TaxID=3144874 RepID=UPI0031FBFCC6